MFKRSIFNNKEVGFGTTTIGKNERILNKNGTFNVNRKGLTFFERFSFFHWMINTKWSTFLFFVFAGFPNDYNAFYCMKYELSQGGYRDFLNCLTYTQQAIHIRNTTTLRRLPPSQVHHDFYRTVAASWSNRHSCETWRQHGRMPQHLLL